MQSSNPVHERVLHWLERFSLLGATVLLLAVALGLTFPALHSWMPAGLLITTPASALGLLLSSAAAITDLTPRGARRKVCLIAGLGVLLLSQLAMHLNGALGHADAWIPAAWTTPMSMSTMAGLALVLLGLVCQRWQPHSLEHELSVALLLSLCVFLTAGYLLDDHDIVDPRVWLRTGEWTLSSLWLIALVLFTQLGSRSSGECSELHRVKRRWSALGRVISGG